jgi:two-component system, NarL family, sensor histidine kinase DevS
VEFVGGRQSHDRHRIAAVDDAEEPVEPGMVDSRLQALLQAVVSVNTEVELPVVLTTIVSTACGLVGAQYGALGVVASRSQRLSEFVTVGISDEQRSVIGPLPTGRGVLGVLIHEPEPLRLVDVSEHPQSSGIPANHPMMKSFLGVPIRVHGEVFGNLYLSEKAGGATFTRSDEEVVVALAAAAGTAIYKAELLIATQRRTRWLDAAAEITNAFLHQTPRGEALRLLCAQAREVAEVDVAAILLRSPGGLVVEVVDGADARIYEGDEIVADRSLTDAMNGQVATLVDGADWGSEFALEQSILAPMRSSMAVSGVLVLGRHDRSERFEFDNEVTMAAGFARQAALALQLAAAESDRVRLGIYQDRDRIARDLHDLVVQRLFAVGLSLRTMTRDTMPQDEQLRRIEQAVDDLDATVKELRRSIFRLHSRPGEGDLRADLEDVVLASRSSLGFMPEFAVEGATASVPEMVAGNLIAVLRESLSNAARHAEASSVIASLAVSDERVTLTVVDNGRGLSDEPHRGGLANLQDRAATLGGSCSVDSRQGSGTTVTWMVPMSFPEHTGDRSPHSA